MVGAAQRSQDVGPRMGRGRRSSRNVAALAAVVALAGCDVEGRPGGGFTFSDRLARQDVLFTPEPDLKPLHDHLTNTYGRQGPVLAGVVKQNIELYTPYRTPHGTTVLRERTT